MMQVHVAWLPVVGFICLLIGGFTVEMDWHRRIAAKQNERKKPGKSKWLDPQHG